MYENVVRHDKGIHLKKELIKEYCHHQHYFIFTLIMPPFIISKEDALYGHILPEEKKIG